MPRLEKDPQPANEMPESSNAERATDIVPVTAYERDDLSPNELREWNARRLRRMLHSTANGEEAND